MLGNTPPDDQPRTVTAPYMTYRIRFKIVAENSGQIRAGWNPMRSRLASVPLNGSQCFHGRQIIRQALFRNIGALQSLTIFLSLIARMCSFKAAVCWLGANAANHLHIHFYTFQSRIAARLVEFSYSPSLGIPLYRCRKYLLADRAAARMPGLVSHLHTELHRYLIWHSSRAVGMLVAQVGSKRTEPRGCAALHASWG